MRVADVGVLRAGLVGCGMMGRHHARVLSSLQGVDLVGIVESNPASRSNFPGGRYFDDLESLVRAGIDYAVVAVPTEIHEPVLMSLCDNGIHALAEKPLAPDSNSARRVYEAFKLAGLIGGVGHIERFNPALVKARELICADFLGDIFQIQTRRQGPFPGRVSDVGVIRDLATHDFDLTSWLARSRYARISAETIFRSGRALEDSVSIVGQLLNGITISHQVNWLSPFKERLALVIGEAGALAIDTLTADLTFFENGVTSVAWDGISNFRGVTEGDVIRFAFPKPEPLRTEHEQFRDAILGRDSSFVTMAEGLHSVAVADAAILSSRNSETFVFGVH